VDASGQEGRDPLDDYHQINEELRLYRPELADRPQVVALNKIDLPEAREHLTRLHDALGVAPSRIFPISAVTGEGVRALLEYVAALLRELPNSLSAVPHSDEVLTWPVPARDPDAFTIDREEDSFRVRGERIEKLVSMLNFAQEESLDRLQRVLDRSGISEALRKAGIQAGDTVRIEKAELEWSEERSR
jgi:GTP-binding protein